MVEAAIISLGPARHIEADQARCGARKARPLQGFYGVLEQYELEDLVAERRPLAKILFTTTRTVRGNARWITAHSR